MKVRKRYPEELKKLLIAEYKENVMGYKRLAERYGLKRDTVRSIILQHKRKMLIERIKDIPARENKILKEAKMALDKNKY